MSEFIEMHPFIFWPLMLWVGTIGSILFAMCIGRIVPPFLLGLRSRREAETETAPKGHFAELRESVERASRGF